MGRVCQENLGTRVGLFANRNELSREIDIDAFDFPIVSTIHSSQVDDSVRLANDPLKTARVSENASINLNNLYFRSGMTMHSQMPTEKTSRASNSNRRHGQLLNMQSSLERDRERIIAL